MFATIAAHPDAAFVELQSRARAYPRTGHRCRLSSACDDFTYPAREHVHFERLRDHLHALVEAAISDDGIFCIAGDEQYLQLRSKLARGVGNLAAVHSVRKPDVSYQEIDPGIRLQNSHP